MRGKGLKGEFVLLSIVIVIFFVMLAFAASTMIRTTEYPSLTDESWFYLANIIDTSTEKALINTVKNVSVEVLRFMDEQITSNGKFSLDQLGAGTWDQIMAKKTSLTEKWKRMINYVYSSHEIEISYSVDVESPLYEFQGWFDGDSNINDYGYSNGSSMVTFNLSRDRFYNGKSEKGVELKLLICQPTPKLKNQGGPKDLMLQVNVTALGFPVTNLSTVNFRVLVANYGVVEGTRWYTEVINLTSSIKDVSYNENLKVYVITFTYPAGTTRNILIAGVIDNRGIVALADYFTG